MNEAFLRSKHLLCVRFVEIRHGIIYSAAILGAQPHRLLKKKQNKTKKCSLNGKIMIHVYI